MTDAPFKNTIFGIPRWKLLDAILSRVLLW